jgi:hypothetical protein
MIPIPGEKLSSKEVDCFTLMPSWIRNLVKVNGKNNNVNTVAYPNLAISIYGGNSQYEK